jgi:hypothetical protein
VAEAQLALGRLLAEELAPAEGCLLLVESARRCTDLGMPEAEPAHEAVRQLGFADAAG